MVNSDDYYSDALVAGEVAYVLGLDKRIDARVPEFEEVEAEVRAYAQAEAEMLARICSACASSA